LFISVCLWEGFKKRELFSLFMGVSCLETEVERAGEKYTVIWRGASNSYAFGGERFTKISVSLPSRVGEMPADVRAALVEYNRLKFEYKYTGGNGYMVIKLARETDKSSRTWDTVCSVSLKHPQDPSDCVYRAKKLINSPNFLAAVLVQYAQRMGLVAAPEG